MKLLFKKTISPLSNHIDTYKYYMVSVIFFFKQKTAYEMRISDWSSDVCSSDLRMTRSSFLKTRTVMGRQTNKLRLLTACIFPLDSRSLRKIGRASCRERVCQYV